MAIEWIYGFHAVEAALKEGKILSVMLDRSRRDKRMQEIMDQLYANNIQPERVDQDAIEAQIGSDIRHQGIIAKIEVKEAKSEDFLYDLLDNMDHAPFLLILDEVQDPHNVGACLRSAEAFGVDAVIVPRDNSCGLTPIVRKVSSGSSERIPFIEVTNISRTLESIKERGIWVTGLSGASGETIFTASFKGSIAIVMGSESSGMRHLTEKKCDYIVKIPMEGEIESLNVSVATGVTLAEAYRQRRVL